MSLITWGTSPWGQPIILHAAWHLLWYSLAAGAGFALIHALMAGRPAKLSGAIPPETAGRFPPFVPRHSLAARTFHWVMAAAMLTLLFSAFLPKAGMLFDWVPLHWCAGVVLLGAIAFHVVHAVCCMDFLAIWPAPADFAGGRKPGKYPLGNKLYHLAIVAVGLTMAATGLLMLWRVRTPLLARDPYRFLDDQGWGVVYALHGLAGLTLVALVIIHVYFALRPEKRPITRAMLTGTMDREYYLTHHDPARWNAGPGKTA